MNPRSREYVFLYLIALLCAISSAKSIQNVDKKESCYIKTSWLEVVEENFCSIDYDEEACVEPTQMVIDFTNEDMTEITKSQTNAHSSLVSVSVSTVISGEILFLIINGVASHSKSKRCVFVKFHVLSHTNDSVTLHADHLQLPNGSYNITAISLLETESLAKKALIQYVVHKSFDVGKTEVRSNDDECTCNNCIEPFHHYQEDSGLLQLFSHVSEKLCSNFSVNILKHNDPSITTEKACLKLNITVSTLLKTDFIRPTRYSNEMPIDFHNIHTGCYIMRMITGMFYGFFWLESTNTILIDSWNTTILLIPRSLDYSVEVTWTSPFNFTLWNLELWYVRDDKVSCEEEKSRGELIDVFGPDKVLSTSTYIFRNLKIGYYCARIYPIDNRCPRSRCSPRSSTTIQLTEMSFERENEISLFVWVVPILVISSLVVGMCL